MVLTELAAAARRVGNLPRKEAFYKYLALQKFMQAGAVDQARGLFRYLAIETKTGYDKLAKEFVKRADPAEMMVNVEDH